MYVPYVLLILYVLSLQVKGVTDSLVFCFGADKQVNAGPSVEPGPAANQWDKRGES